MTNDRKKDTSSIATFYSFFVFFMVRADRLLQYCEALKESEGKSVYGKIKTLVIDEEITSFRNILAKSFIFKNTPQGYEYWAAVEANFQHACDNSNTLKKIFEGSEAKTCKSIW